MIVAKNLQSEIQEGVAKLSKFFNKQNNELEIEGNSSTTMEQFERNGDLDRIVPPNARNFPPKTKLFATYLFAFNEGMEYGYRITMLALANNNASKELMHSASKYFYDRKILDDADKEKIDQEFNEIMHLWNEQ